MDGMNKVKDFMLFKRVRKVCEGSILAALRDDKLIAPLTFAGSCNRQVFEKWLEEILMPTLLPGQTIILDNATFHNSEKISSLIAMAECELRYLPAYSPDLNQIEHQWFPINNKVRKMSNSNMHFRERVDNTVAVLS